MATPLKIPKVKPGMYRVRIFKGITVPTRQFPGKLLVKMKAQEIDGKTFLEREIYVPDWRARHEDTVELSHEELNEILKMMTFDALRTIKKS